MTGSLKMALTAGCLFVTLLDVVKKLTEREVIIFMAIVTREIVTEYSMETYAKWETAKTAK